VSTIITMETVSTFPLKIFPSNEAFKFGSDYGYAWPGKTQIKGSVCHSNGVDLMV